MMLQEAGISRGDCFITNMVKCWPGEGNPDPAPEEIEACAPFLDAQLDIIQPLGIVTFGRYSTSKWIEFSTMRSVQGVIRKFEWPNGQPCFVMPVYHPAYIGRNPAEKEGAVEALRNFREVVYRE